MNGRWQVWWTRAELRIPAEKPSFAGAWAEGWEEWLGREGIWPGTPFLMSPAFEYDVTLNSFFVDAQMAASSPRTREGYARDLAAFLTFLWSARDGRSWRAAGEADHLAYLAWRRRDPDGPRVAGSTWDREVATVNQFHYATCVFSPATALCQHQHDTSGTDRPALGSCQPLDCRNTALTAANTAALREEVTRLDRQLTARPALAPLLHARLTSRRDQIRAFLARYPEHP